MRRPLPRWMVLAVPLISCRVRRQVRDRMIWIVIITHGWKVELMLPVGFNPDPSRYSLNVLLIEFSCGTAIQQHWRRNHQACFSDSSIP